MIIDAHAHACGEFADPRKLTGILDKLGVDRVIPGSDAPWDKGSLENNIAKIGRLNIDGAEKERILGNNIMDILKL